MPISIPLTSDQRQLLDKRIAARSLSAYRDQIQRAATVALALATSRTNGAEPDSAPPLGASRFGGWPDLPDVALWPRRADHWLSFVAQINLAEAPLPGSPIPASMLYIFMADQPWSPGQHHIVHIPAGVPLQRTPAPGDLAWIQALHEFRGIPPHGASPAPAFAVGTPHEYGGEPVVDASVPAFPATPLALRPKISLPGSSGLAAAGMPDLEGATEPLQAPAWYERLPIPWLRRKRRDQEMPILRYLALCDDLEPFSQEGGEVFVELFGYGRQASGTVTWDAVKGMVKQPPEQSDVHYRQVVAVAEERWAPLLEFKAIAGETDICWGCDMWSLQFAIERERLSKLDFTRLHGGLYP